MAIAGIPSTRISDIFVQQRLLTQLRFDQAELYRVQQQLSTGLRLQVPSDDPAAALRAISLQRLREQKTQVQANLRTTQSFLSATDTAVSEVSGILADVRGAVISVADTLTSPEAKQAVAQQIDAAIGQLLDTGNQRFRDRYLFAGSLSNQRPFEDLGYGILYRGNEEDLLSYTDTDILTPANITGAEIFGALSQQVQGSVDLDPILTPDTPLADLRGGRGITPGSVLISDGTNSSVVDISSAKTIGDVARLLEANPPAGNQVTAYVTPKGLVVQLASGNLTIQDVAGGTTASELGIQTDVGVGTAPLVGEDLDPVLRLTTRLDNLLGVRAWARLNTGTPNGRIVIEANAPGEQFNGYTINIVGGGTAGAETVTYDTSTKTITIQIEENVSTAQTVVSAFNASAAAADFTARLDLNNDGTGLMSLGSATTAQGTGQALDLSSGLQIFNGDQVETITFAGAETVEDLLNTLNGSAANVLAQINASRTGIDIRSRVSGRDFTIGENGGTTATQLGVRSFTGQTRLEDLNYGRGVITADGPDFIIRRKDGVELQIDLTAGQQARLELDPPGTDNGLIFRVKQPGEEGNQYSLRIEDSGPGGGDSVFLDGNTLVFRVDVAAGFSAQDAINLLAADPVLSTQFEAVLDTVNDPGNTGSGNLTPLGPVSFSGGRGPAQTVQDVLDLINYHPDNVPGDRRVVARLAQFGNGIELVDDYAGGSESLTVLAVPGSQAAEDLGLLGFQQSEASAQTAAVAASVLYDGAGGNDAVRITSRTLGEGANSFRFEVVDGGAGSSTSVTFDGTTLRVKADLAAGLTASQLVALINNDPTVSQQFAAQLDLTADPGNLGTDTVAATASPLAFSGGTSEVLTGTDPNPLETRGVFAALVRLRDALLADDLQGIQRGVEILDEALRGMNFARAELGARQQGLDLLQQRLETEQVELQSTLSLEVDVDITEAVIQLNSRMAALQAALRVAGRTARLTLLDFI